jgi:hypothetical protein
MKIRASFLPLLLLLFVFAAAPLRAAGLIGQTYEVCVSQLGEPTKHVETGRAVVSDLYTFTQGDWSIEIGLWKGVVHMVSYQRADGKELGPDEINALLAGFGDRLTWTKEADATAGHFRYRRSDRLLQAKLTEKGLTFLTTVLARSL